MRIQPVSYLTFLLSLPIALFAAQGAFAQGAHVDAKPYSKVTDERLEHPDAGDWLMYRRTYDGSGYSPLNQITPSNIRRLTLAWSVSTDLLGAQKTTLENLHRACAQRAGWRYLEGRGLQTGRRIGVDYRGL